MKNIIYIFLTVLVASCNNADSNHDALNQTHMTSNDDFHNAAVAFEDGGALDGYEFFVGVQAEVVEADVFFNEIDTLDKMNVDAARIVSNIDTIKVIAEHCKTAMNLYDDKNWPKRQELEDLTIEWLDVVVELCETYLRPLAVAMSKADEEWTDEELELYEKYIEAIDLYYDVDSRWVDFQYEYAAANNFEMTDQGIDINELINEDMSNR